jgi:hypothetical protein
VYWPALVPADLVEQVVVHHDGRRVSIAPTAPTSPTASPAHVPGLESVAPAANSSPGTAGAGDGGTRRLPLGTIVGARSGDKGGNANVGLWARSQAGYDWLASTLTVERLRELLPEAADLDVQRFELSNLWALNFVVVGLLGEGVAASTRPDAQAKGLGEFIRSRLVDLPERLVADAGKGVGEVVGQPSVT